VPPVKYWEIVADKLISAGWSWAIVRAITPWGRGVRGSGASLS